jgi:hypothetical protein
MEIRNVTLRDLQTAAKRAHVRLNGTGQWGGRNDIIAPFGHTREGGSKWHVTLKTERDKKGAVVFGRIGANSGRRLPGHVCWHGHRAFLRALLTIKPKATVLTAFARYNGLDHFEQTHSATAYRNIGSQYRPMMMSDACDCDAPTEE